MTAPPARGQNNLPYNIPTGPSQAQLIDRDPITAGIQSNPGVIRPVGPPQIVNNGGRPPVVVNANNPRPYR